MAKFIVDTILASTDRRERLVEPFMGGGAVTEKLAPHFAETVSSDVVEDIVLMWQAVIEGWEPPKSVSEEEYQKLRDEKPSALRSFAGFGGSFGGKFFAGYARGGLTSSGEPRNHQGESARSISRTGKILREHAVSVHLLDYRDADVRPGDVVYCDPPYAGTFGYSEAGAFDTNEFIQTVESWAHAGAEVFVSEYSAPEHWEIVGEKSHRQSLVMSHQRTATTERVFRVRSLTPGALV